MTINAKQGDISANSYVNLEEATAYFAIRRNTINWDNLSATNEEIVLKQAGRDVDAFNFVEEKYYEVQAMEFPRDNHETVIGNCATWQGESTATLADDASFKSTALQSSTYNAMPSNYWQYGTCHLTDDNLIEYIASSNRTGIIHTDTAFTASLTTSTAFRVFAPIYQDIKDAQCEQALFILDNPNINTLQTYKSLGSSRVTIGDVSVELKGTSSKKIPISSTAKKLISKYIKLSSKIARA